MSSTTILAVDLGKYKCLACTYDRATASAEYCTITTSRAEVERLGSAVLFITGPTPRTAPIAGYRGSHDLLPARVEGGVAN